MFANWPQNIKGTRTRRDVCVGRNGKFWGTKQGHLPEAIWCSRWFYTVVSVCLFRLGFLLESASGHPRVIMNLSLCSFSFLLPWTISPSAFSSLCHCWYPTNLVLVSIVTDDWAYQSLLLHLSFINSTISSSV